VVHAIEASDGKPTSGEAIGISIMGTIVHGKETSRSVALIKDVKSGKVTAIKTGNVINDQYKVVGIRQKFITVMTRTAEKFLVYQEKFAGEFRGGSGVSAPNPNIHTAGDSYREDGFERANGKVTMTSAYRDKIVKQDLPKVLMQATAEPHLVNGLIAGFKLSQIDQDSIYAKGGLKDEDIITSINEHKLTSVAGAISLLQSLKESESVEVELVRGGQPVKMSLQVK